MKIRLAITGLGKTRYRDYSTKYGMCLKCILESVSAPELFLELIFPVVEFVCNLRLLLSPYLPSLLLQSDIDVTIDVVDSESAVYLAASQYSFGQCHDGWQ